MRPLDQACLLLTALLLALPVGGTALQSVDDGEGVPSGETFSALMERLDMPMPTGADGQVSVPECIERTLELMEAARTPDELEFARAVHGFWLLEGGEDEVAVPLLEDLARELQASAEIPEWWAFQALARHDDLEGQPDRAARLLNDLIAVDPGAHRSVHQDRCLYTFRAGRPEEARVLLETIPDRGWVCLDIEDPIEIALELEQALDDRELEPWLKSWVGSKLSPSLSRIQPRGPWHLRSRLHYETWCVCFSMRELLLRVLGSRAMDERILSAVSKHARASDGQRWQLLDLALQSWPRLRADLTGNFPPLAERILASARRDLRESEVPIEFAALCGMLEALPARTLKELRSLQDELEPGPAGLAFLVLVERQMARDGTPSIHWMQEALASGDLELARAWASIAISLDSGGAYASSVDRDAIVAAWKAGTAEPFPELDAESLEAVFAPLLLLDGL